MLKTLLLFLLNIFYRVRIEGDLSVFQKERKLLIIANHQSFLDGLLIALFLPVNPLFIIYTGVVRNPLFRWILGHGDYATLDHTNPLAMKQVVHLLNNTERPVVIFPEGRITLTGSVMKVYDGTAFAALKTGARILPLSITGALETPFSRVDATIAPKRLFGRITLTVHPPFTLEETEGDRHTRRQHASEQMRKALLEGVYRSAPKVPLPEVFLRTVKRFGKKRALYQDERTTHTTGSILKRSLLLGRFLSGRTRKGERVGVLLPNAVPTAVTFLALTLFKRVPAMLNFASGFASLRHCLEVSGVHTIITSKDFIEKANLHELLKGCSSAGYAILFLEDIAPHITLADKIWLMGFACWSPRSVLPLKDITLDDEGVVLFTSGSEGKPKGVVLSHRSLISNVLQIETIVDLAPYDIFLTVLPLFHSYGLTAGFLLPLHKGAKVIFYPSPLHYRIIPELVYEYRCTVLFGTSTFLRHYGRFGHSYDMRTLRFVIAGGEKLSDDVLTLWQEKFGILIGDGYGATETAPVIAVNSPHAHRRGSVGKILPGIEYRLVPQEGIEKGGELHVKGDNCMKGYLKEKNQETPLFPPSPFGEGWYNTGDIAYIDKDGFLFITGRAKRFAKVAGEMVSLEAVEQLVMSISPFRQHGVIALPDEERGEKIILFTTDHTMTRNKIRDAAKKQHRPDFEIPRKVEIIDEMPRLGTGKTDNIALKRIATGQHA